MLKMFDQSDDVTHFLKCLLFFFLVNFLKIVLVFFYSLGFVFISLQMFFSHLDVR